MTHDKLISDLVKVTDTKILMLVLDGVGDVGFDFKGTPLEEAKTPNMDKFAHGCDLGLTIPLMYGITPGSGPAHLSLFGYDAIKHNIGRGLLSALGSGFELKKGDLCIRLNLCKMDKDRVSDRRAGRLESKKSEKLIDKLNKNINIKGVETFFIVEKEHRAILILRGGDFGENLSDSDPQKDGLKILEVVGDDSKSIKTAKILNELSNKAQEILKGEEADAILMRGYSLYKTLPSFKDKYKLDAGAFALYPMYKGVGKLCGMDVIHGINENIDLFKALRSFYEKYNFFFVHVKDPDKYGEDGNFQSKQKSLEDFDVIFEKITSLNFDVVIVCGDHSTPALMSGHSWHGVPFMIKSKYSRALTKASGFSETECAKGELGNMYARNVMTLALAHAGKLRKFGA